MRSLGREEFTSDGGEATRNLKEHQERTAATETMLTMALLTFGYIQVIELIFATPVLYDDGAPLLLSLMVTSIYIVVMYLTWIIGKDNLHSVLADNNSFIYKEED